MAVDKDLLNRAEAKCELCSTPDGLVSYVVPPSTDATLDQSILICGKCHGQIEQKEDLDINHWRCLNESMWSQTPAVQVMAWRMLKRLNGEGWAQDLFDMLYLEEETLAWAQSTEAPFSSDDNTVKHLDSNGAILEAGDTVILIKDLNVKGGGFTAKRGTAVRGISLVPDTPEHIEGRVNGQQIVILTKYVKKS
ncbi:alkylphosphonate utilization protein [uncultured Kiloniella sp.]|uniref:PhnA domain-containing protein n=1 Tax=uncultured Kiloniella sp. TaxID=1133091 RepID=UPI002630BAA6|nr:alkylphosphonate utilization protein [uncultured Kiloniella sp.]